MKILAIRGSNLASLEGDFEIDFTADPLKSAGIFAITGQTGAGKSTILDALCLALFDNAPRLSKAESVNIQDVEDKTITQKDSRNILRRGTGEGYAEVDFVALNGDKYRSRWSVRRARGKASGSLQATSLKVENLSKASEEQGTKSQLLNRIVELIGLTFEQFTRAVLLAQGDFANFLKARSNEKAELLEKLTGTEVYSEISILIYQKTQEAKSMLDIILQRIKDIRLLPEEELNSFKQEKQEKENELLPLRGKELAINKKLTWLKQEEQIKQEVAQASEALNTAIKNKESAASHYKYMEKLDASLEIRDSYIELSNKISQQEKTGKEIENKEKSLSAITKKQEELAPTLTATKKALDEAIAKHEKLKPDIDKAKELDITVRSLQQQITEAEKEIQTLQLQSTQTGKEIEVIIKSLKKNTETKESLIKWFTNNASYQPIISRMEIIDSLIKNITTNRNSQTTAKKSLQASLSLLKTYTTELEQIQKEFEQLNALLPTEVLNLRSQLHVGEPCPVCGSTHHPLKDQDQQKQMLNEATLEQAKKANREQSERVQKSIEHTQKSITEFETYIQSFQNQYEENFKQLKTGLSEYPLWEEKLTAGTLQKELNEIAAQWNKHKNQIDEITKHIENEEVKLQGEEKAKTTLTSSITQKLEIQQSQLALLKEHTEKRLLLLEGKSTEEVEKLTASQSTALSNKYEELRKQKDVTESKKATLAGSIAQLKEDFETTKDSCSSLTSIVVQWVKDNPLHIDTAELKELIEKPRTWVNEEKKRLTAIKEEELTAKATLSERQIRLQTHQASEDKPQAEESSEMLHQQLVSILDQSEFLSKRLNEINVSLLAHQKGVELMKEYQQEVDKKKEYHENWAKLNELFGSANGNKFKTIAQGYTLDILLSYANIHLSNLSKRYRLEKIPNSLALQVIDNDQLGEVRSVHSLSGGESFLVSLALALGLSSLSSNRMKIESLFIDEGFGSLDADTLSIAMDALENLQTQGRKIGVISHVEEMKERITTQIQVIKSANSRSHIHIVG